MSYDQNRQTDGGGSAALLMLLVGLLIVGGGAAFLWYRSHLLEQAARRAEAAEAMAMARRAQQRAAVMAQQRRSLDDLDAASVESAAASNSTPEIAISLNADGDIHIHGARIRPKDLEEELLHLAQDQPAGWRITIWADEECAVRHLTDLLTACKELGFEDVQIASQPLDTSE